MQPRGEAARGARDFGVRVAAAAESVVVHEKLAACLREIREKVNERVSDHE
jgi:hypothetical protein